MTHFNKKVMIGMSGGVDSSVAAAILLEQGFETIGITLKIWQEKDSLEKQNDGGCCSLSAVDDARRVANQLGIPYYVLNFQDAFMEKVIEPFKSEYLKGRTPNPCIACNRYIKFDMLLKKAISMGIDRISTGHYARIEYCEDRGRFLLKKSEARGKDQTYVLYNLTQSQLERILMPLGSYQKPKVREMAAELGFSVANKPDSQEICFVEDNDYGRFIRENTTKKILTGDFVDAKGNQLGKHLGLPFYTIGQRKGLGIAFGKPMFVIGMNVDKNQVILGRDDEVFSKILIAEDLNLISIDKLDRTMEAMVKIRYSAEEAKAQLEPFGENQIRIEFEQPQRAVTPGQAVVFYQEDVVVGGGTIKDLP